MTSSPRRFEFLGIEEKADGDRRWIEVTASHGGRRLVGRSPAVDEESSRSGIGRTARAAFDAVEQATDRKIRCELNEIDHVHRHGKQVVVLVIDVTHDGKQTQLFGNAPVETDAREATARAALDACGPYVESVLG